MNRFRFLLYGIVVTILLFIPVIQKEKKVTIKQKSSTKSVSISLAKAPQKVVKKVTKKAIKKPLHKAKKLPPKKKRVIKKKSVKKKKIIKKKVLKKAVPPKPKIDKEKILRKKLAEEKIKKEKERKKLEKEKLEKEKLEQERIEKERAEAVERERQKRVKYLTSLKEQYYAEVYNTIASKKRYPKKALRFKKEGSVKVGFTILADGSYRDFHIITPSNEKIFNKAVKKLFKKLHYFEKPPSEIELPLHITISINYNIKR